MTNKYKIDEKSWIHEVLMSKNSQKYSQKITKKIEINNFLDLNSRFSILDIWFWFDMLDLDSNLEFLDFPIQKKQQFNCKYLEQI